MRRLVAVLAASIVAMSACSSEEMLTVQAAFTDVGDLAPRAPVMFADIRVGEVEDIELVDGEAVVTMTIAADADVPRNVVARVRRTSVLGERILDLSLPEGADANAPALADGATIDDTVVRSDFEDLVVEGSEIFGVISASELATMIDEGARGFGGRGEELGALLLNLRDITGAYADETPRIRSLVRELDSFNTKLAAHSGEHRRAVARTAQAIGALAEESGRLEDALHSLARLARGSRSLLDAHVDEMDAFFHQMDVIVGQLAADQADLAKFLLYAPRHNRNVQMVEYTEFNQIMQEFVICGLNDNPDDPARTCEGGRGH